MIYCRPAHLSLVSVIFRSKHYLIPLLRNPKRALREQQKKVNKAEKEAKQLENEDILTLFPKEFYRKTSPNTKMARKLYLTSESTAKKIAQYLTSLPDLNRTFVEINPGAGFLTKVLIENGMTDLRLFEENELFFNHLKDKYANVYPDHVKIKHADLISLHKSWYADRCDTGTRIEKILQDLPVTEWQDDINFRLFGATASTTFFKYLINSIIFQSGLMALGRCELYMVLSSITYMDLTSSSKAGFKWYMTNSILFQIFFEYELLDKFESTDFLPHVSKTIKITPPEKVRRRGTGTGKGVKCPPVDRDLMYFVKIVPRRNLYEFCTDKQIQELWHFMKRMCFSRTVRIIELLENLIPGSGAKLLTAFHTKTPKRSKPIHTASLCEIPPNTNPSMTLSKEDYCENLNIFTQFGDLEPSELFTLYHEFRLLPEYSTCNFLPSLEAVLLKMTGTESETSDVKRSDDGDNKDDEPDDEPDEKGNLEVKDIEHK